jgi:molybdopterin converting factor small subunit
MDVTIRLFGIRRELIDRPFVEIAVPEEATLRTLLETLGDQFGERVRHQLFSADGRYLGDTICLAVNDYIVAEEALETPLKDMGADQPRVSLSVVFAIAGG